MKKKIISVLMLIVLNILAYGVISVSADTEGIYTYSVSNGEATITDCDSSVSGTITVPSTLGGYPVTAIGNAAFSSCDSLRGVIIPDTVTIIGNSAFYNCENLLDVTLSSKITSIGNEAFSLCGISKITIPDSVTTIGERAFYGTVLSNISLGKGVTDIGANAFELHTSAYNVSVYIKDLKNWCNINFASSSSNPLYVAMYNSQIGKLYLNGIHITELVIPDGVTEIKPYAFYNSEINTVKLPDSVTKIGECAFYECINLETVELSDELTDIGDSAFCGCINLTELKFSDKLKTVGTYAFSYCEALTELTFLDGLESIGAGLIAGCENLTTITLPQSLKSIGQSLCGAYSNLYPNLEMINYNGDINTWLRISIGSDNNHFMSVPVNYYWYVTYIDESGEIIQQDKVLPNSKVKLADFSPNEDYVTEYYTDEALTTVFDSSKPINKNTDIYTKVYLPLLNEIQIAGDTISAEVGTDGLTYSVNFATDKEATVLFCYIRYPESLTLNSVVPKEFNYAAIEDKYSEEGYTTAVILTQYSETEWIPQLDILNPFDLVFDVLENAKAEDVAIEITEESFLSGNEAAYFENRIAAELKIIEKLVKGIEINGDDSISTPTQYFADILPDDAFDKTVVWSVDNEAIATVDELGILTPVTSGNVVLTATAKDGSGVFATKTIEIVKYAESIEIVGSEEINEPSQYSVIILPEYTTNKNAQWSVSDETVATVDENGVVTPLKNGKIVLTARAEDASGIETTKSIVITVSVRANSITSDVGVWDKDFDSDITEYTLSVPSGTTAIYLTSSFIDATAKVNGSVAANGVRKKVTLTGAETEIEIVLSPTIGNNLKANTYKITVVCGSFTKTELSEDEKTFIVTPVNVGSGKTVIIALYESGKLAEIQKATYEGEALTFTTDKTYTSAKVMVWSDMVNLMPVCVAETVK